jgi:hypothetical protein
MEQTKRKMAKEKERPWKRSLKTGTGILDPYLFFIF